MENFKQYIGTSPAGVEWVAYRPENVEKMTKRLAEFWAEHDARRLRAQRKRPGYAFFIRYRGGLSKAGSAATLAEIEDAAREALPRTMRGVLAVVRALTYGKHHLEAEQAQAALEVARAALADWDAFLGK